MDKNLQPQIELNNKKTENLFSHQIEKYFLGVYTQIACFHVSIFNTSIIDWQDDNYDNLMTYLLLSDI